MGVSPSRPTRVSHKAVASGFENFGFLPVLPPSCRELETVRGRFLNNRFPLHSSFFVLHFPEQQSSSTRQKSFSSPQDCVGSALGVALGVALGAKLGANVGVTEGTEEVVGSNVGGVVGVTEGLLENLGIEEGIRDGGVLGLEVAGVSMVNQVLLRE